MPRISPDAPSAPSAPSARPVTGAAASEPLRTLLTPITLRTAGERIAERIVTAIALGEFVPVQRLQTSGYVTTKRGRGGGTFVRTGRGPDADGMIARTLVPAWADLTELL